MNTTELITPPQTPYADKLRSDPRHVDGDPSLYEGRLPADALPIATAGRDTAVVLDYWPILPFMMLVAVTFLAFAPLFALAALIAIAGAIVAAPFMLIHHLLTRG